MKASNHPNTFKKIANAHDNPPPSPQPKSAVSLAANIDAVEATRERGREMIKAAREAEHHKAEKLFGRGMMAKEARVREEQEAKARETEAAAKRGISSFPPADSM